MKQEDDALSAVINWISLSSNVVFLTGSELLFDSGIQDVTNMSFNPDIRKFKNDPEVRQEYWKKLKEYYPKISFASPTPAHESIYELSLFANVSCIITQNGDGLHQKAGNNNVIEIYANIHWATCPDCGKDQPMTEALGQLEKGKKIPTCTVCNSDLIKPPISFPGQPLPHWDIREAWIKLQNCDLFIIVGADLENEPVASFPFQIMNKGDKVVIISETESPADDYVSAVLYGKPDQILPHIAKELKSQIPIS